MRRLKLFTSSILSMTMVAAFAGCMPGARPVRFASLELTTAEGDWRLDDVARATLALDGWSVTVAEAKVSTASKIPYLERIVLEFANTSPDATLVLEPGEIRLRGFGKNIPLGPAKTVTLKAGQKIALAYSPGIRAELLPHPFIIDINVFRGPDFKEPQKATLTLY